MTEAGSDRRWWVYITVCLILSLIGMAQTWGGGVRRVLDFPPTDDPAYMAEQSIVQQIAAYPPDAACLLITDVLPWEIAYQVAPRRLFRYDGPPDQAKQFIREKHITCVIVFASDREARVLPAEHFL